LVTAPRVAVIATEALVADVVVETMKPADNFPGATVTVPGTVALADWPLETATTVPPTGAGAESFTVPVELPPAMTVDGLSERETRLGADGGGGGGVEVDGIAVSAAVLLEPP